MKDQFCILFHFCLYLQFNSDLWAGNICLLVWPAKNLRLSVIWYYCSKIWLKYCFSEGINSSLSMGIKKKGQSQSLLWNLENRWLRMEVPLPLYIHVLGKHLCLSVYFLCIVINALIIVNKTIVWGEFWTFVGQIPCWKCDENYRCFLGKENNKHHFMNHLINPNLRKALKRR